MILYSKSRLMQTITEYTFYCFLAIFPFLVYSDTFLYFGTTTRSVNLILFSSIFSIILGIFLLRKETEISIPKSFTLLSLLLYFTGVFVSALFGNNFGISFYSNITRTTGIWYLICLGIFLFFLIDLFKNEKKRENIIWILVSSSALFSFLSALGPEGFNLIFKNYTIDAFTFGNSTFAGMYLFASFILSIYLLYSSSKKSFLKIILPILIILNPYIINFGSGEGAGVLSFLGEARASGVAFFGSIFLLVFFYFLSKIKIDYRKRISYILFSISIIVIIFSAVSLFSNDGVLRKFYLSQATSARVLVWELSDKLIKERPFLGWGTDSFEKVFELNYDNRILDKAYGEESWFDRAHNVFIDQAFENGLLGLILYILIYITLSLSMIWVILNSKKEKSRILALFIIVYTVFHLLELQTAFDTSISYLVLAIMLALSIAIFRETQKENNLKFEYPVSLPIKYVISIALIVFGFWSLFLKIIPFVNSQLINGTIRTIGSSDKRISLYPSLFNTPIDLQAVLWRTTTDFQRGISQNPEILNDPKKVEGLKKEMVIFEEEYRKYTEKYPNNFRALLNYADTKMYFMLFGVNKLDEAQQILDKAMELVPNAPHPLWMKSVAYLYAQKFDLAKEFAKKALEINPNIEESQKVFDYIEKSIKDFPEIDLFFFSKI